MTSRRTIALTGAQRGLVSATYLVAFMALLDVNIVIIALPALQTRLGASSAQLQWVVDSYTLCLSTVALSGGALGDRYGRKRVFLAGVGLFTLGSAVCAAAPAPSVLLVGRFAQGVGAAAAVPGTLSLITRAFTDPRRRARIIGGWGSVAGVAGAVGPVAGGGLITAFGWRAIFLINLPLGLAALIIGARCIDESADPGHAGLDWAGQALGLAWLGALAYGLINARSLGWCAPGTVAALAVAAAAAAAFFVAERRHPTPMLPLQLFTDRGFTIANIASVALGFTAFTLLVFLPSYLQQTAGHSAALTGLMLLPWPISQSVTSILAGRWSAHSGPRFPMATGLMMLTGAAALLLALGPQSPYPLLAAVFIAFGAGVGLTFTPSNTAVMAAVAPVRAGTAAATVNATRQTGTSLGVAVLGLFFYQPQPTAGLHQTAVIAGIAALAATLLVAARPPIRPQATAPTT